MSVISKLKNMANAFKGGVPLSYFIPSGIGQPIVTKTDTLDFYTGWVFRCVDLRAKGLAAVDYKLYQLKKDGSVDEIAQHELLDLLYRVNPDTTKFDFLELTANYLDLFGAAPWVLEGGKKFGQPKTISLARPEFMKVKKDKDGNITGWEYQIGSFKKEFEKDEVIFLKNYNPKSPDRGLGVIEAVRTTAQHNDYIGQHNTKLLENGARPSGYVEVEGKLSDTEYKRLKKEIKSQYQGYLNAYNVYLLEGGTKFTPAMIPPKDLEFIAARDMNRDEIAGIFGVPKSMLGYTDATRASAKTSEYIFAKWTLEPLITKYFEQLNEFLVPRYGDNLWLSFEPIAKDDEELALREREISWNKWKTTNEIRAEEGLDPIKGGDNVFLPLSNMPMMNNPQGDIGKGIVLEAKEAKIGKVDFKTQQYIKKRILNRNVKVRQMAEKLAEKMVDSVIAKKKIVLKIKPEKKSLSDEQIQTFYKRRMEEETSLENMWEKGFIQFFTSQKERFVQKLEDNRASLKGIEDDLDIDVEEELKSTVNIISPLMYQTLMKGSIQASEVIGEPAVLDMDFFKQWLDKVSEETGKSINDTTIQAFADTLKEGIANGEDLSALKSRVETVFDFATASRATMIARTETARGVTEAHRKMYEHYGFEDVKWLLAPGACEECVSLAGENWTVKSIEGQIPVHPNCKCDYTPL